MALRDTVTGDGRVIGGGRETGSYSYTVTSTDKDGEGDPTTIQFQVTVFYTEEREERKWWALTLQAITDYKNAHPDAVVTYNLANERLSDGYEMVLSTVERTITNVSVTSVPTE